MPGPGRDCEFAVKPPTAVFGVEPDQATAVDDHGHCSSTPNGMTMRTIRCLRAVLQLRAPGREACSRVRGTRAAGRNMNLSGGITRVPSRPGVFGFSTTWPAPLHCTRSFGLCRVGDEVAQCSGALRDV